MNRTCIISNVFLYLEETRNQLWFINLHQEAEWNPRNESFLFVSSQACSLKSIDSPLLIWFLVNNYSIGSITKLLGIITAGAEPKTWNCWTSSCSLLLAMTLFNLRKLNSCFPLLVQGIQNINIIQPLGLKEMKWIN